MHKKYLGTNYEQEIKIIIVANSPQLVKTKKNRRKDITRDTTEDDKIKITQKI